MLVSLLVLVALSTVCARCAILGEDNGSLPPWAVALKGDVRVLIADIQSHQSKERLDADIAKIRQDLDAIAPIANKVKTAAEKLISDFNVPRASNEQIVADGTALVMAILELRD
jgi:hypothetical protein